MEEDREGDYYLVELGQMEKEIEKQGAGIREIVWSAFWYHLLKIERNNRF